jgi:hypothetical protein
MLFPQQVDCCKKRFHENCLNNWYAKSPTCPCCRCPKNIGVENNEIEIFNEFFNVYYNSNSYILPPMEERQRMPIPRLTKTNHEIVAIFTKYARYTDAEFSRQLINMQFNEICNLIHKIKQQEAQQARLQRIQQPPQEAVEIVQKKRGRPIGSKNKPRVIKRVSGEEIMAILNN